MSHARRIPTWRLAVGIAAPAGLLAAAAVSFGGIAHADETATTVPTTTPTTVTVVVTQGTSAGDTITGGTAIDVVHALGGADKVTGGDAGDRLYGEGGNDTLNGDAGNDLLVGDVGNDTLVGGAGNDRLYGNGGDDTLDGGDGNDLEYAADGYADRVTCGAGADTVWIDVSDTVADDCETVYRPTLEARQQRRAERLKRRQGRRAAVAG